MGLIGKSGTVRSVSQSIAGKYVLDAAYETKPFSVAAYRHAGTFTKPVGEAAF